MIQTTKVLNGIACGLKSAARCLAEVTGASSVFQSLSIKIGNDWNRINCVVAGFFLDVGCFFSLAWLPLIAMTQNGKVDKVCFLFAPTRQRVVVLFDIWSLSKKAPILFCLQFAVCCVDLCIDVCIYVLVMILQCIYLESIHMAHMAVYR